MYSYNQQDLANQLDKWVYQLEVVLGQHNKPLKWDSYQTYETHPTYNDPYYSGYASINVDNSFLAILRDARDFIANNYGGNQWIPQPPVVHTEKLDENKVAENLRKIISENTGFSMIQAIDDYVSELEKKNFAAKPKITENKLVAACSDLDDCAIGSRVKIGSSTWEKKEDHKWYTLPHGSLPYQSSTFSSGIFSKTLFWVKLVEKPAAEPVQVPFKQPSKKEMILVKSLQEMSDAAVGSKVKYTANPGHEKAYFDFYTKAKNGGWWSDNAKNKDPLPLHNFGLAVEEGRLFWEDHIIKAKAASGTATMTTEMYTYEVQNPDNKKPYVFKVGNTVNMSQLDWLPKGTVVSNVAGVQFCKSSNSAYYYHWKVLNSDETVSVTNFKKLHYTKNGVTIVSLMKAVKKIPDQIVSTINANTVNLKATMDDTTKGLKKFADAWSTAGVVTASISEAEASVMHKLMKGQIT